MKIKNIKEKTRPIWKVLPYGSFVNWGESDMKNENITKVLLKLIGHVAYAGVSTVIATNYLLGVSDTGSWSYLEQKKIRNERIVAREEAEAKYAQLEQRIFGTEEGLANTDYDGELSPREKLDAYERMDLDSIIVLPARKPTLEQLERAEHSYQTEQDSSH